MASEVSRSSLSDQAPTHARFVLSAWLAAAAALAYLCRNCIGVAEKTIRFDLGLTEQEMGRIMGIFFWSYALAQIPGGWLGDRWGSRRCLPIFAIGWSLATAAWGVATGTAMLIAARIASGLGQAGYFPCAAESMSRWHPPTERATASGILTAAMQVGAIVAALLTGVLLEIMSWQAVFVLFAAPGLLWAAGFYWWYRDRVEDHPGVNDAERELILGGREPSNSATAGRAEPMPWRPLISSGAMWMLSGQQFFRAAAYVWFATWFPTYLQETRDVTRGASGWLTTIPLLASLVGSLFGGVLSDWVLRGTGSLRQARQGVAVGSTIVCSGLVFLAYFIEDATLATLTIGMGAFFAACAGPIAYAATIDMGGRHVATVFGTMNMAGNFGAALFATIVPDVRLFVDGRPELVEFFGDNSWNAVLVLFGVMYVLAAACWALLSHTGSVFESRQRNVSSFEVD
jgi:MFS family permease